MTAGACAAGQDAVQEATVLAQWVTASRDHQGMPFALVDKRRAEIHVFHADGTWAGSSAAILGATPGDHTVPGVGQRAQMGRVRADERTTPAGRFVSSPGRNLKGEHVVWADYEAAFAIHRLRPDAMFKTRALGLHTPSPHDNRQSLGCVVVPVDFYVRVVERVLGQGRSVVYVMPETRDAMAFFRASL